MEAGKTEKALINNYKYLIHAGVWFLFLWLFHCMRGLPKVREAVSRSVYIKCLLPTQEMNSPAAWNFLLYVIKAHLPPVALASCKKHLKREHRSLCVSLGLASVERVTQTRWCAFSSLLVRVRVGSWSPQTDLSRTSSSHHFQYRTMSKMQLAKEAYQGCSRHELVIEGQGYVKEFTRHSNDVLLNLNELRHRNILTDATLLVGSSRLQAHCAVLIACSGFFYSLFSRHKTGAVGEQGVSLSLPEGLDAGSVALLLDFMYTSRLHLSPGTAPGVLAAATYLQMEHVADTCRAFLQKSEKTYVSPPLMDLASRNTHESFTVSPGGRSPPAHPSFTFSPSRPAVDMEEPCPAQARVPQENSASVEPVTCQSLAPSSEPSSPNTPSPGSPCQSRGQPNSPAESSGCSISPKLKTHSESRPTPDPKACNWKKYKYIVLNPLCSTTIKEEGQGEELHNFDHSSSSSDGAGVTPKLSDQSWSTAGHGLIDIQTPLMVYQGLSPHTADTHKGHLSAFAENNRDLSSLYQCPCPSVIDGARKNTHSFGKLPFKVENHSPVICYSGNQGNAKSTCSAEKPYRCNVCGAQFNRPANLKTHSRIHSGEKPYRCDTCGARFVQVAHLRAHVLIHTGEKPYPCHTCGTRFRHLQTLKSHLRIHTGEKPYSCEKCDLRFRHKSQLRLHLRQKHGAVTNTKIRYKVLADPYQTGSAILQAS